VAIDPDFWASRRVLLTGHTGFKGAWLALWLQALGADVTGLASGPATTPSMYREARVGELVRELAVDVRDPEAVSEAVREARPEIVLHLAAQPMVRRSLREPALTYAVNVMGTVNVLEAVRLHGADVRAVVVVTSDKCYENPPERARRFVERDPLGGRDPYSSSKACAELVASAYQRSLFADRDGPRVATARAGNVIGGGDWGEDRLLPDAVRAVEAGRGLRVRNPDAVRPWQHVLNPLGGYLLLAQALWESPAFARAWNMGPPARDAQTVASVLSRLADLWDGALGWGLDGDEHPPEAGHLALDSTLAERELGWRPPLDLDGALRLLVEWHRARDDGRDMRALSLAQISGWVAR
jgi:CDP-glucose 4,6-dehydratase